MTGAWVLLAAVLVGTLGGALWRARNGRLRATAAVEAAPPLVAELAGLGLAAGERATFVQFSSAFCAPCRATRTLLRDVAERTPGVRHHEVDAEAHLDLVRRLGIHRTPTVLVLDAAGREVVRAVGQPRREAVLAALGGLLEDRPESTGAAPAGYRRAR